MVTSTFYRKAWCTPCHSWQAHCLHLIAPEHYNKKCACCGFISRYLEDDK